MTHDFVGFQLDSNPTETVEKNLNLTQGFHNLTHELTHDFALRSFKFSLHQDSNGITCKKELQRLAYRFFSFFHTIKKNNNATLLCRHYLLVMAYSLRSNLITFKSVSL